MIEVKKVVKRFGNFTALCGVNLNVRHGSVYGLVGPNGAGKTTLIKHLTGIYRPNSGEIKIDGEPVYENAAVKSRVAYVSDDLYFFPGYSIKDTAAYFRGISPKWSDTRFKELEDVFKISPKRGARRLSKGMQKQAAFWLALSANPDVMILDEPVDGLDPVMRKNVWSLIQAEIKRRGMNNVIHAVQSPVKPVLISHIADKESDSLVSLKLFCHVPLFHLIPGIDDDFLRIIFFQSHWNKSVTKRSSASGDQNCFVGKHHSTSLV